MGERIAYHNGLFVPERQAQISLFDSGLATGQKVVEVSRTFGHRPYKLKEHIARLYKGLKTLRIDPGLSPAEMQTITEETLSQNLPTQAGNVDWQILNYVTEGPASQFEIVPEDELRPTVLIHCIPLVNRIGKMADKYTHGVNLVVVDQRAMPQDIIPAQIKSNGRMDHLIGRLEAKERKPGSTGVLLDREGNITEGTGTSLFVVRNEEIQTAPSSKVLNGLTREMIFEIAGKLGILVREQDLTVPDAKNADEIFVTSTVICLLHGRSLDDVVINNGQIGPVTEEIRKAFIDMVGVDYVQQARDYQRFLQKKGPVR